MSLKKLIFLIIAIALLHIRIINSSTIKTQKGRLINHSIFIKLCLLLTKFRLAGY